MTGFIRTKEVFLTQTLDMLSEPPMSSELRSLLSEDGISEHVDEAAEDELEDDEIYTENDYSFRIDDLSSYRRSMSFENMTDVVVDGYMTTISMDFDEFEDKLRRRLSN